MKAIKITPENREKIAAAITEAEGRARVRCISVNTVFTICERVFDRFEITKKALEGVKFTADPNAQHFPNAYRYTPESTRFTAVYKRGAWYLTDVRRGACFTPSREIVATLTDAAKAAIITKNTYFAL